MPRRSQRASSCLSRPSRHRIHQEAVPSHRRTCSSRDLIGAASNLSQRIEYLITAGPRNEEDGMSGRRGLYRKAHFHPFMRASPMLAKSPRCRTATRRRDGRQDWRVCMNMRCTHLDAVRTDRLSTNGCEECLRTGDTWVHLRLCRTCGHVGCCDDSLQRAETYAAPRSLTFRRSP